MPLAFQRLRVGEKIERAADEKKARRIRIYPGQSVRESRRCSCSKDKRYLDRKRNGRAMKQHTEISKARKRMISRRKIL